MKWIYKAGRFAADLLHPNRCPVCDSFIDFDSCMCFKCRNELEFIRSSYCNRCGQHNCICLDRDIYYDHSFSFVYYIGNAKKGILSLKDGYGTNFARFFSDMAVQYLKDHNMLKEIDIITAVPVTKSKMHETAYNHAYVYAKMIHRHCNIQISRSLLEKKDDKLIQHELSSAERKIKAFSAFAYSGNEDISGKTILLCDDVITTGSTLSACAKLLKDAGAKKVICATIAMTRLENDE